MRVYISDRSLPCISAQRVTGEIELAGLPDNGDEDTIRQALADLLGVDISMIVLPDQSEQQRRQSRKIVFEIIADASLASKVSQDLSAGDLTAKLSQTLSKEIGVNISAKMYTGAAISESGQNRREGEVWVEVGGEFLLKRCPPGFLLVNTTVELSACKECDAGSYSFKFTDGCNQEQEDPTCDTRECTTCPAGATCSKGGEAVWRHFQPRPITVGGVVHPLATLIMDDGRRQRFFCEQEAQNCLPLDSLVPEHAEAENSVEDSYVWEYVTSCQIATQPCFESFVPSVLLRRCPPGTVLLNSTQSGRFDPALQECTPCGPGTYVVDPFHGPCLKCPDGALCPGEYALQDGCQSQHAIAH